MAKEKLLYEDIVELIYGGEVGEEMYGPFGQVALADVVKFPGSQSEEAPASAAS